MCNCNCNGCRSCTKGHKTTGGSETGSKGGKQSSSMKEEE